MRLLKKGDNCVASRFLFPWRNSIIIFLVENMKNSSVQLLKNISGIKCLFSEKFWKNSEISADIFFFLDQFFSAFQINRLFVTKVKKII